MVAFHPEFEEHLNNEAASDVRQRALVWFSVNGQQPKIKNEQLQEVLAGIMDATSEQTMRVVADSHPREWVELTVLNEFGPNFRQRPAYSVLVDGIYQRLFSESAA
jgi:hypothetical protein